MVVVEEVVMVMERRMTQVTLPLQTL